MHLCLNDDIRVTTYQIGLIFTSQWAEGALFYQFLTFSVETSLNYQVFFYRNVNWIKNQTGKFVHFLSISILIKHMVELIVSGLKWSKNFCCIELYTSVSWVFNWHRKNYQTFWRKSCHLVLATLGGHILSPNCDFLYFW